MPNQFHRAGICMVVQHGKAKQRQTLTFVANACIARGKMDNGVDGIVLPNKLIAVLIQCVLGSSRQDCHHPTRATRGSIGVPIMMVVAADNTVIPTKEWYVFQHKLIARPGASNAGAVSVLVVVGSTGVVLLTIMGQYREWIRLASDAVHYPHGQSLAVVLQCLVTVNE